MLLTGKTTCALVAAMAAVVVPTVVEGSKDTSAEREKRMIDDRVIPDVALERDVAGMFADRIPNDRRGAMPPAVLRLVARHCIAQARAYGFEAQSDIAFFAINMFTVNPAFHRQAQINEVLTDPAIPVAERLGVALREVDDDAWNEASHMTDAAAYWREVLADALRRSRAAAP